MYYQNLYFSTHVRFGAGGHGGGRRARRPHYAPRFNPTPRRSGAIERMVARVPATSRADVRRRLTALQGKFPQVMREAGQQLGTTLHPGDVRDVASVAGVAAFQELRGVTLTNAQFRNELRGTYDNFKTDTATPAQYQQAGETYEMAILLMSVLKQESRRPGGAQAAGWLRGLAQETLLKAYSTKDATTLRVGTKGIERSHK